VPAIRPAHGRAGGFTLLEMLVAVAVLGVALVTLLGLHARNIGLAARSQELTQAGTLASRLVATTRAAGVPQVGETQGRFVSDSRSELDVNTEYGGPGSDRFVWAREVVAPTSMPFIRIVTVSVGHPDTEPLVQLSFGTLNLPSVRPAQQR
jgi:general secretion pathway protein I